MAIALAVMARAPRPGHCKSRLAASIGAVRAAAIYAAILRDTLDTLSRTGAQRLILMAAPEQDGVAELSRLAPAAWEVVEQRGEDLGTRLTHSLGVAMADGLPGAVVSSDAPLLDSTAMSVAFSELGESPAALLGPCTDGGYYLLATTRLEPGLFEAIPWSTEGVAAQTRLRCSEHGLELRELPEAYDVDDDTDLARLVEDLSRDPTRAPMTARVLGLDQAGGG